MLEEPCVKNIMDGHCCSEESVGRAGGVVEGRGWILWEMNMWLSW